jgi:MoaA/NifB/PqqE/SkfB family radical SAM enzyme
MLKYNYPIETSITAFCPLPFTKLLVNAWGDVTMCCHIGSENLGNIMRHDIMSMWKSDKAKEIRQAILNGKLGRACNAAPNCPFHLRDKIPFSFETNSEYPLSLEIDLPDKHCNIGGENPTKETACIMCVRSHSFPKNQPDLRKIICRKVRPLMPHLKKLCVLGVAEPFWKDAVFDIFQRVGFEKYKENILFETNHNVTCFGNRTQDRFQKEVVKSNLQFSLDAATPETYVKIRRLDAYDLCIKNLKRWISVKNDNHKVTIWNNINMLNVHEMVPMVQTAIDLGVESIYMLPTHNQNNKVDLRDLTINEENVGIFEKHSCDAMHLARLNGMDLRLIVPFHIAPKTDLIQIAPN